jgi:hypothetical protein
MLFVRRCRGNAVLSGRAHSEVQGQAPNISLPHATVENALTNPQTAAGDWRIRWLTLHFASFATILSDSGRKVQKI